MAIRNVSPSGTFTLTSCGDKKVAVIKVLTKTLGFTAAEAKSLVESAPTKIDVSGDKVDRFVLQSLLEQAGATVEIERDIAEGVEAWLEEERPEPAPADRPTVTAAELAELDARARKIGYGVLFDEERDEYRVCNLAARRLSAGAYASLEPVREVLVEMERDIERFGDKSPFARQTSRLERCQALRQRTEALGLQLFLNVDDDDQRVLDYYVNDPVADRVVCTSTDNEKDLIDFLVSCETRGLWWHRERKDEPASDAPRGTGAAPRVPAAGKASNLEEARRALIHCLDDDFFPIVAAYADVLGSIDDNVRHESINDLGCDLDRRVRDARKLWRAVREAEMEGVV